MYSRYVVVFEKYLRGEMMKYFEIFKEIIDIMENDYSGCEIKRDWGNSEYYRQLIKKTYTTGELDRSRFKEIVDDYLLDYKDTHVGFSDHKLKNNPMSIGFKVRRHEDILYVINISHEKNFKIGMPIIELDNVPIKEASSKFERQLMGQPNERQLWEKIIIKCKTLTVLDDGKTRKININICPDKNTESKYEYKCIDEKTVLLSYNDFMNYELSQKLLAKYGHEIKASQNLIIDVRRNSGGFDTVYYELLDYIFPENFNIVNEYSNLTNVTERNYKNRMEMLTEYIKQYPNDEMIKRYVDELTSSKNKGFVTLDIDKSDFVVKGTKGVKNVVVLTDRYCGSSGDSFVILASHSPWVTIIGRSTYGVIDYSNVAEQKFEDDFSLYYATSVYEGVKYGKGYDNIGVKPEIYIPWSPEHINKDVDLEYALKFLKTK